MTEDQLLSAIIEAAHWHGWLVHHVRNSKAGVTQGDVGFPDLVLARRGQVLYLELKTETGKLTPGQEQWRDAMRGMSAQVIRPRDLDMLLEWLK